MQRVKWRTTGQTICFSRKVTEVQQRQEVWRGLAACGLVLAGRADVELKPGDYLGAAPRPDRHDTFYNRLKADSRSLVAVVHYLLEREDVPVTNHNVYVVVTNQSAPSLAMPTNYSGRMPAV